MACSTIELRVPAGGDPVVFDSATDDGDGNLWTWERLDGWWEPPEPDHESFPLGDTLGETVTRSTWKPRTITLRATADLRGGDLNAALDTLTALSAMLATPGRITVNDTIPKYATVYLADQPSKRVVGDSQLLEVQIPMVAYDVFRYRVSDDVGVL